MNKRMSLRETVRATLERMGRGALHIRGQNFLVDDTVLDEIIHASGVRPGDVVLEIGPGLGMLTERLLAAGARVTAIELDPQFASYLRETFGDRVRIIEGDALQADLGALAGGAPYRVIANIPYNITSLLLLAIVHASSVPLSATLMVQSEVASRVLAGPPDMNPLSLLVGFHAVPRIALKVSRASFSPSPKVDSAVLHLAFSRETVAEHLAAERLAARAFRVPRKKISNTLGLPADAFIAVGLTGNERPSELSRAQWVGLARFS